jgi:hypothetical protein
MKRTTITLPDDLAVVLEREARRRQTSVSEVARQALIAHLGLADAPKRRLPFVGLGASGHTDTTERLDEILAEEWPAAIERHRDR